MRQYRAKDGRSALDRALHGRISELLIDAIDAFVARHAAATNPTTFMVRLSATIRIGWLLIILIMR